MYFFRLLESSPFAVGKTPELLIRKYKFFFFFFFCKKSRKILKAVWNKNDFSVSKGKTEGFEEYLEGSSTSWLKNKVRVMKGRMKSRTIPR